MKKIWTIFLGICLFVSFGCPSGAKTPPRLELDPPASGEKEKTSDPSSQKEDPKKKDPGKTESDPLEGIEDSRLFFSSVDRGPFKVKKVSDGDTITIDSGKKEVIRLIGINAPEKNEPLYKETADALKKMVENREIYLLYDREKQDRYRRTLAYIFLKRGEKYFFVNGQMVKQGMAISFPFGKSQKYKKLFDRWEQEAEKAKRGIWKVEYNWKKNRVRVKRVRTNYYTSAAYTKAKEYRISLKSSQKVLVENVEPLERKGYEVIKIFDGDTVELEDKRRIRLLGIDCPERKAPFYEEAKVFLTRLIEGKKVYLQYDKKKKDRYGRSLAHLYVKEEEQWLFVNGQMIRSGFAHPYFISPNQMHKKKFYELQKLALEDNLGFWTIFNDMKPERYYVSSKGHFHRPGCMQIQHLKRTKRYNTRREAFLNKKTPARCCNP